MSLRNVLLFSIAAVAIVYMWPNMSAKIAKKLGDTTVSAFKAGANEATK